MRPLPKWLHFNIALIRKRSEGATTGLHDIERSLTGI